MNAGGKRLWFLFLGLNTACGSFCGQGLCEGDSPTPSVTSTPGAAPFADRVVQFIPGEGSGFGQDLLPDVVLGPPEGAGRSSGSLDVLTLGLGGSIVLELDDQWIVDEPGPDFIVFENPFYYTDTAVWQEPGIVSISEDGSTWHAFPCEPEQAPFEGCAGLNPVYSSSSSGISPLDPLLAGGDAFDLSTLGLLRARFIRIEDPGVGVLASPSSGFDLDGIAVLHGVPLDDE